MLIKVLDSLVMGNIQIVKYASLQTSFSYGSFICFLLFRSLWHLVTPELFSLKNVLTFIKWVSLRIQGYVYNLHFIFHKIICIFDFGGLDVDIWGTR